MSNLDSVKDVRTIAAVSALIAVGASSSFFYNKISKIEEELEEIQNHLAAIIPHSDPKVKVQVEQVIKAIQILDKRLAKTQEDLGTISKTGSVETVTGIQPYHRLTPHSSTGTDSDTSHDVHRRTVIRIPKPEESDSDSEEEEYSDDEDDIAAMM